MKINSEFIQKCLNDTCQGLREGLSDFSGPSNVAVIFRLKEQEELHIYDPDGLLRGHELKIKSFYYPEEMLCQPLKYTGDSACYSDVEKTPELDLDGLISFGGSSPTVPYQVWFTEHHPDIITPGPIRCWLEHSVLRFSHDVGNESHMYSGISGKFLREYATHAIYHYIKDELFEITGNPLKLNIYDILHAVLTISETREEGQLPMGKLVFLDTETIDVMDFHVRFADEGLPRLSNPKHVRKLLQSVENSEGALISDGESILGISQSVLPYFALTAHFYGRNGFVSIGRDRFCSFINGRYKATSLRAKLYEVEEELIDQEVAPEDRDILFRNISALVHRAQALKHGTTFVIDFNDNPVLLSGQILDTPLNLRNEDNLMLASAFSKVDGALHIGIDNYLYGFACLLDGAAIGGEDRARGARYNSALRFTAHNSKVMVIVVSSDRPVSVIMNGIDQHGHCMWKSEIDCALTPMDLPEWLEAG